jgi:capsular polysaccharide biosynthesis protein
LPDNGASEESLAVLSSQQFTQKFIEEHQLMPKLYPKLWDAATGKWKVPPDEQPTAAKAYKRFDKMRTITKNSKTGLISLDLDWRDRLEAASLVNTLVEKVNAEMRQRATQNADVSMRYLQHELTVTADIGTVDSLNRLMQTEIRQKMLADVTEEYAFKFVDRALPPDVDDPISPKKMILVPAGFLLGLVMGVVGALILHSLRQPRAGVD